MIGIKVRDFRGCDRADIAVAPIALISGLNGAAKSSICQAVAAALTGKTMPIPGLTKSNAGALVRAGAAGASAEVSSDAGATRVTWPACTASTEGDAPRASDIAAGLLSIADMKSDERARALAELLRTDPTRDDFAAAMTDKGLGDNQIVAPMWKLVCDQGWDGAHKLRRDKGAELKGAWRQVTGQTFGSRIAAAYTPQHWSDDLDSQTDRELEAAVADAKAAHHRAIASAAADAGRREIVEAEASKVDERTNAVEEAARELTAIEDEIAGLRKQRDALPSTRPEHASHTATCWSCQAANEVVKNLTGYELRKPPEAAPENAAALKQARLQMADIEGKIANREGRVGAAKSKLSAAQASLDISRNARAELAKLPAPSDEAVDITGAEAAVTWAEHRLAAFKAKVEADSIRDRIASNELLLEILAPDALRARKLTKVLELFNSQQLAPLCETAGWRPVEIKPDMAVTYGGRPFALLSASEQYRVRAVLQIAVANLDGSHMVVIDAADILDGPTRSGLLNLLIEIGLPALVALTLTKRSQLPDLAASGLGQSFWVESGVAETIGQAGQREAA